MRIIIRKKKDTITIEGRWSKQEIINGKDQELEELDDSFFDMSIDILKRYPKFKEITLNTELTEDGENNH